jgi:hypothetical protein
LSSLRRYGASHNSGHQRRYTQNNNYAPHIKHNPLPEESGTRESPATLHNDAKLARVSY